MSTASNVPSESQAERRKAIKSLHTRDILGLKTQIDKRNEQRGITLFYLMNNKFQSALIFGRQLLFTSSKVYKQFDDSYQQEFEQTYFYRTNRRKEYLQYLLDCSIVCRVYMSAKKKEDLIEMFEKIQFLEVQERSFKSNEMKTQEDIILFNQYHENHSKTMAILLTLIELSRSEKLTEYTEKFFRIYLSYTKRYYSAVQFATGLFKYANYLFETGQLQEAEIQYLKCIDIRGKNVFNQAYIDALINCAVCTRGMCKYKMAIEKIEFAIEIYKDISFTRDRLSDFHLFLGKLHLQNGDFDQAYENMRITYIIRQNWEKSSPARVEIQLNLLFLLKTLKDIDDNPDEMLNIKSKKEIELKRKKARELEIKIKNQILNRQDFAKYKEFKSSKMSHLSLTVSKECYYLLSSDQSEQLASLLKRISYISFFRGISELHKCTFYEENKIRNLLQEANPQIKNVRSQGKSGQ